MHYNSNLKCPSGEHPVCEFKSLQRNSIRSSIHFEGILEYKTVFFFSHFSQTNLNLLIIKVLNASRIFCFLKNIVCVNRQNFRVKEEKNK